MSRSSANHLIPLLFLLCCPAVQNAGALHAQILSGRVLDATSNTAVPGVTVTLVDESNTETAQTESGDDGAFSLTAPRHGLYRLRAQALGYDAIVADAVWIGATDTTVVELRISTQPIELQPLTVVARSRTLDPRLQRLGFYEREDDYRDEGRARFLTADSLNASHATRVTELLRDNQDIVLVRDGFRTFVRDRRGRSIPIFLDGHRLKLLRDQSLDELIALNDIGAVEIYYDWAPAQFGGGAAVVLWTGRW